MVPRFGLLRQGPALRGGWFPEGTGEAPLVLNENRRLTRARKAVP